MDNITNHVTHWQKQFGRHDLPWQLDPTPYRVWVSEIMLQQTQVKTVIPYYLRFMEHCPDVKDLALLPLDKLMLLWQGLGYYSRARNLHSTANIIYNQGYFPDTLEELITLPGIGESTAAAILSLAYNQPHAILDGNVKRIFCRYYGISKPPSQALKTLWQYAKKNIPSDPKAYTQGLMDLGATLCTRTNPKCNLCPLIKNCHAYQHQKTNILPVKLKPKPKKEVHLYLLLSYHNGELGLERRPSKGIWAKLYTPTIYNHESELPFETTPLLPYQHILTHRILHIHPYYTYQHNPKMLYSPIDNLSYAIPTGIKPAILQLEKIHANDLLSETQV